MIGHGNPCRGLRSAGHTTYTYVEMTIALDGAAVNPSRVPLVRSRREIDLGPTRQSSLSGSRRSHRDSLRTAA